LQKLKIFVLLRNEASASDGTDSSFLRMTEVKKDCRKSRTEVTDVLLPLLFY